MELIKTLRWFGQNDAVSLADIRQTGATGIVTALHHIPNGEVWPVEEILKVKQEIESHEMTWEVVESLPVHESIKKGLPESEQLIKAYQQSVRNLGECGIHTICYNFMPVLDWARTDLHYLLPNGAEAMYFSTVKFAAFDVYILKRPDADNDYQPSVLAEAKKLFDTMSLEEAEELAQNIIIVTQSFIDGAVDKDAADPKKVFLELLAQYDKIDKQQLRANLSRFLEAVLPVAEEAGVSLAIHPDDPPFPLLGLPRIVSTRDDYEWLIQTHPSLANGVTFCTGSLGASVDNNLLALFDLLADRVHFLHLRSTQVLENGDFYEASHLEGNANMPALMEKIITEQHRRSTSNRTDIDIPVRPDHGHKILDDFHRQANPGYPLIGRLKGLAELHGLEKGVRWMMER